MHAKADQVLCRLIRSELAKVRNYPKQAERQNNQYKALLVVVVMLMILQRGLFGDILRLYVLSYL